MNPDDLIDEENEDLIDTEDEDLADFGFHETDGPETDF